MRSLRSWFEKTFPPEEPQRPRAERRPVPGLEAIHWTGSSPGLDIVRNISATGMYLVTRERWPEGEVNPVRLVYPELGDDSPDHQVTLETKAVRWGEDGMGLTFLLPECMELWLWKTDGLIDPEDILSEFRLCPRACVSSAHLPFGNAGTQAPISRRAQQYSRRKRHRDHPPRRSNASGRARF